MPLTWDDEYESSLLCLNRTIILIVNSRLSAYFTGWSFGYR